MQASFNEIRPATPRAPHEQYNFPTTRRFFSLQQFTCFGFYRERVGGRWFSHSREISRKRGFSCCRSPVLDANCKLYVAGAGGIICALKDVIQEQSGRTRVRFTHVKVLLKHARGVNKWWQMIFGKEFMKCSLRPVHFRVINADFHACVLTSFPPFLFFLFSLLPLSRPFDLRRAFEAFYGEIRIFRINRALCRLHAVYCNYTLLPDELALQCKFKKQARKIEHSVFSTRYFYIF